MRETRPLALALTLVLGSIAPWATAQAAAPTAAVQKRLDKAARLFKEAKYDAALAELRAIDKTTHLPVVRFNIARCLEELGKTTEAIAAFERYLSSNDTATGNADRVRRAREALGRLEKKGLGSLEVLCLPAEAKLTIEGITGTTNCPFRADEIRPGGYTIVATAPGYETLRENAVVQPGQKVALRLQLLPAEVVRSASATEVNLTAPRDPSTVVSTRSNEGKMLGVVGTGLLITGGAALAGGGVFLWLGSDINDRIEAGDFSTAQDLQDAEKKGELYNTLAIVSSAVGVAAAGTGLVLMILAPKGEPAAEEPSSLSLGPVPGGAMLTWGGAF